MKAEINSAIGTAQEAADLLENLFNKNRLKLKSWDSDKKYFEENIFLLAMANDINTSIKKYVKKEGVGYVRK